MGRLRLVGLVYQSAVDEAMAPHVPQSLQNSRGRLPLAASRCTMRARTAAESNPTPWGAAWGRSANDWPALRRRDGCR